MLRRLLADADAVIVSGGLGPTHDDVTREAIAAVMGVDLRDDDAVADGDPRPVRVARAGTMPDNNLRQAQVPDGATVIPQTRGTAPGLICPVRRTRSSTPSRACPTRCATCSSGPCCPTCAPATGEPGVIASRVLRTWGESESGLNERLDDVVARLDGRVIRRWRSSPAGGTGSRSGSPPAKPDEQAAAHGARRVGGRGPRPARLARVRHRRRVDGVGRPRPAARAGPDARHRRVGHRRARRRPGSPRSRARATCSAGRSSPTPAR